VCPYPGEADNRPHSKVIDKSLLALPEPRRVRDRDHVKSVAKQPCLVCGRQPADAHHVRFAQHRALGRKVSDEFTIPPVEEIGLRDLRGANVAPVWAGAVLVDEFDTRSFSIRSAPS
jgi:hypothetical protein